MADPQLVVRNAAGQVVLDSRNAVAGCCVEILIIPAATAVTRTYPDFPGRTAMPLTDLMIGVQPTVDTALGYPRVTWSALAHDRLFAVFIL